MAPGGSCGLALESHTLSSIDTCSRKAVCTHKHAHTCTHIHVHTCKHMLMRTHACTRTYTHAHAHTDIHAETSSLLLSLESTLSHLTSPSPGPALDHSFLLGPRNRHRLQYCSPHSPPHAPQISSGCWRGGGAASCHLAPHVHPPRPSRGPQGGLAASGAVALVTDGIKR